MAKPVYKIVSASAFAEAKRAGQFRGSPDDLRDGFIHLSAAQQLAGTLAKHFAGQQDLVLLAVNAERLGVDLKWEPSRGGELFPHLYAPLDLAAVLWSKPLRLDNDGSHILPEGVSA
jgi:uncharacterized protein (DUF952 family)